MFRIAVRKAVAESLRHLNPTPSCTASPRQRLSLYSTHPERIAGDMIRFALLDSRSRPSADWRDDAMRILEQGISNLQQGGEGSSQAVAMLTLAISTLLYEGGKYADAMDKLELLHLSAPSPAFRVVAWEGLIGLKIEAGQDASSSLALNDSLEGDELKLRANAISGLAALVNGEIESAKSFYDGFRDFNLETGKFHLGNAILSYGEYLHCTGNFTSAKEIYERAIREFDCTKYINNGDYYNNYLAGANMVPQEVSLGVTCALGQLLSHTGEMEQAEELLTKALTMAENHFGSTHPKVGIVLTCIARMFKEKAKLERSSSILVQEGLYRRALDLLKAPDLSSDSNDTEVKRKDIISLARGGYAELLMVQQNRKEEGERIMNWAENKWANQCLSLAQALDFSLSESKVTVVDTRVCRVL